MRFLKRMLGTLEYHDWNTSSHHGQLSQRNNDSSNHEPRGLSGTRCKVSHTPSARFGDQPGSSL